MRFVRMWFVVACVAFCLMWAAPAAARTRVTWSKVEVREGDDQKRVAASMTRLLVKASRKAKWGKGKPLELNANITKLSWETRDDVVLVSVTVVAKISGGKSARSHIRIGGRPSDKRKLETQALGIVADGLVTRLSDIARRDGG